VLTPYQVIKERRGESYTLFKIGQAYEAFVRRQKKNRSIRNNERSWL
jgi:hypothetical protein